MASDREIPSRLASASTSSRIRCGIRNDITGSLPRGCAPRFGRPRCLRNTIYFPLKMGNTGGGGKTRPLSPAAPAGTKPPAPAKVPHHCFRYQQKWATSIYRKIRSRHFAPRDGGVFWHQNYFKESTRRTARRRRLRLLPFQTDDLYRPESSRFSSDSLGGWGGRGPPRSSLVSGSVGGWGGRGQ